MLNVGLTGGIACGKSTVANMLVRHGACLLDMDKITHELQEPEKPAWKEIVDSFGTEILNADNRINREKLGRIVFGDNAKLKVLNKIVHPYVLREWHKRVKEIREKNVHAVVLSDVPLMFEEKLQYLFDLTLLVLISPEEQIQRLMARSGLTQEEAQKRLNSQMPIGEKIKLADIVIDNRGTFPATEEIVGNVWRELLKREETKRDNP
ncbi:MAG TPA: dephospho-CoA kinase [Smithellaceae bacterium]|nr:dephospho-CoA kinase [Smithellaceae bacterium]